MITAEEGALRSEVFIAQGARVEFHEITCEDIAAVVSVILGNSMTENRELAHAPAGLEPHIHVIADRGCVGYREGGQRRGERGSSALKHSQVTRG